MFLAGVPINRPKGFDDMYDATKRAQARVFEAAMDERTKRAIEYLCEAGNIPSQVAALQFAVEVFECCHDAFTDGKRVVMASPDLDVHSRLWPLHEWPGWGGPKQDSLKCHIDARTAYRIDDIKQNLLLQSDDDVLPMVIWHMVQVFQGIEDDGILYALPIRGKAERIPLRYAPR